MCSCNLNLTVYSAQESNTGSLASICECYFWNWNPWDGFSSLLPIKRSSQQQNIIVKYGHSETAFSNWGVKKAHAHKNQVCEFSSDMYLTPFLNLAILKTNGYIKCLLKYPISNTVPERLHISGRWAFEILATFFF